VKGLITLAPSQLHDVTEGTPLMDRTATSVVNGSHEYRDLFGPFS
jgi:hypothetical protein